MSAPARNPMSVPGVPSLYEELLTGRIDWTLIASVLRRPAGDEEPARQAAERLSRLLDGYGDPEEIDGSAELPAGLLDKLRADGLLHLAVAAEYGGLGLDARGVLRVIETAARWSPALGMTLAFHNGLGAPQYLPLLADGPLREFLADQLSRGALTGAADAEPAGAANWGRAATAVPTDDGTAYLLSGTKLYTGNGDLADLLTVTATVQEDGVGRTRLFFVDTRTPGLRHGARHTLMGLKGVTLTTLTLDGVRVPAERVLAEEDPERWRAGRQLFPLAQGRLHVTAAPALALTRQALEYVREFVRRRTVDGRPLGEHDEIRRTLATALADLHAMESVVAYGTLVDPGDPSANAIYEQFAAKSIASVLAWRTMDAAMTVVAGEGYETAASKAGRGTTPSPLERLYRDARGLRIAGGAESLMRSRLAGFALTYFVPAPAPADGPAPDGPVPDGSAPDGHDPSGTAPDPAAGPPPAVERYLSPRNRDHAHDAARQAHRLHTALGRVAARHPDLTSAFAHERLLATLGTVIEELLTVSLTLGRTAHQSETGSGDTQDLADIHCAAARHRLAGLWGEIDALLDGPGPRHDAVSESWLRAGEDRS
ncbi:acyl-CoA dehydrogenase family protein [Streptomyces sp. NPDC057638]|uniref:acyl-CoA dehydrogenase family protein n=1 Tax=Streptomyces sp. NPDC057638 TaxID=3346190 RepID=UPI00368B729B